MAVFSVETFFTRGLIIMIRKASKREPVKKPISRLLGSLMGGVNESSPAPLLLKSLIALDALHRGKATTSLLTLLAQQLLVAEELCAAGYQSSHSALLREAHSALIRVYSQATSKSDLKASGDNYEALRDALIVYDVQLNSAPRARIRDAEIAALSRLIRHLEETAGVNNHSKKPSGGR
ncbi:hypothetical protein [Caballeronia grimmiae]|uniref:hypothetical protein n=1 Tax=Caballeronia grimmiae TaxID=1071679 RepID=UPI0038BDA405